MDFSSDKTGAQSICNHGDWLCFKVHCAKYLVTAFVYFFNLRYLECKIYSL